MPQRTSKASRDLEYARLQLKRGTTTSGRPLEPEEIAVLEQKRDRIVAETQAARKGRLIARITEHTTLEADRVIDQVNDQSNRVMEHVTQELDKRLGPAPVGDLEEALAARDRANKRIRELRKVEKDNTAQTQPAKKRRTNSSGSCAECAYGTSEGGSAQPKEDGAQQKNAPRGEELLGKCVLKLNALESGSMAATTRETGSTCTADRPTGASRSTDTSEAPTEDPRSGSDAPAKLNLHPAPSGADFSNGELAPYSIVREMPGPYSHTTSVRVSGGDANDAVPLKVSDTVKLLVGDSAGQMGVVSAVGADGRYEVDERWFERSQVEFQH